MAAAKQANTAQPDTHDYSEAETRKDFIDLLLKEAGWQLDPARTSKSKSRGMPNNEGKGFVDYVLWGDDGKPLALIEAKRTTKSASVGQQQAKLYADCLEAHVRPAPGHLLFQRLRALDVGRRQLSAARRAGLLQEAGTRTADSAPHQPQEAGGGASSTATSSNATTRPAPCAASAKPSRSTTSARPCW